MIILYWLFWWIKTTCKIRFSWNLRFLKISHHPFDIWFWIQNQIWTKIPGYWLIMSDSMVYLKGGCSKNFEKIFFAPIPQGYPGEQFSSLTIPFLRLPNSSYKKIKVVCHKTRRVLGFFWVQNITGASEGHKIPQIFQ